MTGDLEKLMANLSDTERDRLKGAFAADPELAQGLSTMLADLPADTQAQLLRRLAVHLGEKPLGGGALVPRSPTSSRTRSSGPSARTSSPGVARCARAVTGEYQGDLAPVTARTSPRGRVPESAETFVGDSAEAG